MEDDVLGCIISYKYGKVRMLGVIFFEGYGDFRVLHRVCRRQRQMCIWDRCCVIKKNECSICMPARQLAAVLMHRSQDSNIHRHIEERLLLIHISEPMRQAEISYAVFCLNKKNIYLFLLLSFFTYFLNYLLFNIVLLLLLYFFT